jgi:hypothetical protein
MSLLMRELLEQKRQRRRKLPALSFPEKIKIVEQMRETTRPHPRFHSPGPQGSHDSPAP